MQHELTYDDSRWPLLLVTMPASLEGDALARHLARIAEYLARGVPQTHVIDMRACEGFLPQDRARIAEFAHGHAHLSAKFLRGKAYVVEAWRQHEMIGSLHWQNESPYPVRVFSEPRWALVWASARLDAAAA